MGYDKVQKSPSWTPQPQGKTSPFAPRPMSLPAPPPTRQEIENQAFMEHKHEAVGLQLQAKYGTITREGQERLTVLQAKMDAFRQQGWESTRRQGTNLLEIPGLLAEHQAPQRLQPKLVIGKVGDKYEQEADRVAAKVVSQINAPQTQLSAQSETLQRQEMPDQQEELQMKSMVQLQSAEGGMAATPDLEASIQQAKGSGQPLSPKIRQPMEQAFGADFSRVKVHADAQSDQLNQSIQAKAFTTGQDIFFRQGAYQPENRGGQELLAHELTHVMQQNGSAVQHSPQKTAGKVLQAATLRAQLVNHSAPFQNELHGRHKGSEPENKQKNTTNVTTSKKNVIQRGWEQDQQKGQIYKDDEKGVIWHWESDKKMWLETMNESSPYSKYAGIENKAEFIKWYFLSEMNNDLIEKILSETKESGTEQPMDSQFSHLNQKYILYKKLLGITGMKHENLMEKQPFNKLTWKEKAALKNQYIKNENSFLEDEEKGLDTYYGPGYKVMNPFLRAVGKKYPGEKFETILCGFFDEKIESELLQELRKIKGTDVDSKDLYKLLAQIRGTRKDLAVKTVIKPMKENEEFKDIKELYRGDNSNLIEVLAKDLDFSIEDLNAKGEIEINKDWTQYQFVSTTVSKEIGPPASTGLLWHITLGENTTGQPGGLYTAESEILFPAQTVFKIKKIVIKEKYKGVAPKATKDTKYIVFAQQG